MRSGHGADHIEGVLYGADPVAQGLVHGILERGAAGGHGHHFRAEKLHAADIWRLAADVLRAHENLACKPEARRHRGRGHAVLAGTGLGNDPALPHAAREQDLADGVVDLVRAGVGEVLALQKNACAAGVRRETRREVHGRRPAHVVAQQRTELGEENGVSHGSLARGVEF